MQLQHLELPDIHFWESEDGQTTVASKFRGMVLGIKVESRNLDVERLLEAALGNIIDMIYFDVKSKEELVKARERIENPVIDYDYSKSEKYERIYNHVHKHKRIIAEQPNYIRESMVV